MITCSFLGSQGRLGNNLYMCASMIGIADKYGCGLVLPTWKYADYFNFTIEQKPLSQIPVDLTINEPHFHYSDFGHEHSYDLKTKNVNISGNGQTTGYLQSEKYWEHCKERVLQQLSFKKDFIEQVRSKQGALFNKPVIAIHIRRGDYVGNPNYELLPIHYYIGALMSVSRSAIERYNILILSDDIDYCKPHFQCLPNVFFSEGNSDIEDLCLMSECNGFILSNSSYSWWGCYLSTKPKTFIIRPNYLFAGDLLKQNNDCDFWIKSWHVYEHKDLKNESKSSEKKIPGGYAHI